MPTPAKEQPEDVNGLFVAYCKATTVGKPPPAFDEFVRQRHPELKIRIICHERGNEFSTNGSNTAKCFWLVEQCGEALLFPTLRSAHEFGRLDGFRSPQRPDPQQLSLIKPAVLRGNGTKLVLTEPGQILCESTPTQTLAVEKPVATAPNPPETALASVPSSPSSQNATKVVPPSAHLLSEADTRKLIGNCFVTFCRTNPENELTDHRKFIQSISADVPNAACLFIVRHKTNSQFSDSLGWDSDVTKRFWGIVYSGVGYLLPAPKSKLEFWSPDIEVFEQEFPVKGPNDLVECLPAVVQRNTNEIRVWDVANKGKLVMAAVMQVPPVIPFLKPDETRLLREKLGVAFVNFCRTVSHEKLNSAQHFRESLKLESPIAAVTGVCQDFMDRSGIVFAEFLRGPGYWLVRCGAEAFLVPTPTENENFAKLDIFHCSSDAKVREISELTPGIVQKYGSLSQSLWRLIEPGSLGINRHTNLHNFTAGIRQPDTTAPQSSAADRSPTPRVFRHRIGLSGTCEICGCTARAIQHFGWECREVKTS